MPTQPDSDSTSSAPSSRAASDAEERVFDDMLSDAGRAAVSPVFRSAKLLSFDDAQLVSSAPSTPYRASAYMTFHQPKPLSKCLGPTRPMPGS